MSAHQRKRIVGWLARLVGPAVLLVLVLRLPDPGALWAAIRQARGDMLALAVVLNFAVVHAKVQRWRLLLAGSGTRYPLGRAWIVYLASSAVGMLTPGRVGDVLRATYVRAEAGVPLPRGVATVVADRLCDLVTVVAVAIASFPGLATSIDREAILPLAGAAFVMLGGSWMLLRTVALERAAAALPRGRARRLLRVDAVEATLRELRSHSTATLAGAMALSVVAFGINYLQGWLLARALSVPLSFYDVMALLSTASILALLPVSVSGLGVREAFFGVMFARRSLPHEAGIAFGLLVFCAMFLSVVVAGTLAWPFAVAPRERDP